MSGPPTYGHFDASGKLIDQITFPLGRALAGVSGGKAILAIQGPEGVHFERVALPLLKH